MAGWKLASEYLLTSLCMVRLSDKLYSQATSARLANLLAHALTDLEAVRDELASMHRLTGVRNT